MNTTAQVGSMGKEVGECVRDEKVCKKLLQDGAGNVAVIVFRLYLSCPCGHSPHAHKSCRMRKKRIEHMNASCRTFECAMSHVEKSHGTQLPKLDPCLGTCVV